MIGSIRATGSPTVKTVTETLALLQVVGGGDKEVRKLLEEIRETQEHNDQVLSEARTAKQAATTAQAGANEKINELTRAKAEMNTAKDKFHSDIKSSSRLLKKREDDVSNRETEAATEKTLFSEEKRKELLILNQLKKDISQRIVAVEKRETLCAEKQNTLKEMFEGFTQTVEALSQKVIHAKSVVNV